VIPTGYDVGRIPLLKQIMEHGTNGYAAAELAYTRYGQALAGEARVDGNLDEWAGNTWVPVGEPFQARTNRDQQDYRDTPRECYTRWAFKRGKTGIYLAARVTGDEVQGDQFTIWFDPRSPQLLGTPGTFYWVTGSLNANGTVRLNSGETSARIPNMTGAWAVSADGLNLEIYLPYALFDATSWPVSGDLGVSIAWVHNGANGKQTTLNWSEDGFPWTPRWFGVVRDTADAKTLPYMVRIK